MALKTVDLPNIGQVTISKNRRSRHIRIKVTGNQAIRVTLPYWAPYKSALSFINTQTEWILNQQQHFSSLKNMQPIGKAHHLHFDFNSEVQSVKARINRIEILITLPPQLSFDDTSVQATARRACIRALQREAQTLLPQRLKTIATQKNLTYRSISTRQLKSRWGSCNQDNDIKLNIFLMQLPWQLIDYVILHELVHTKIHNHSSQFWAEMKHHEPNIKQLRREMRKYHPDF